MVTFKSEYVPGLRTSAIHLNSASKLITDAPVDNHGKGESFSPTDLVATALGSCMATVMGIHARKINLSMEGLDWTTEKIMRSDPRRIDVINIKFDWKHPKGNQEQRQQLKEIALNCPVALSLHPQIHQNIIFNF